MPIDLHNFILIEMRLVQVETQSNDIDGVLDEIQDLRKTSNLDWEDIASAYYECKENGTITFYESEVVKEGNPGTWTYVIYDCVEGEEEIVLNSDIDVLDALSKVRQEIEKRKAQIINLLPNAENAVVDVRKLRDYCLNKDHDIGKHKARLFWTIFNITIEDAEDLRHILLEIVKTNGAIARRQDTFGQRYTVDFTLQWKGTSATVRSAWIIEHDSNIPRLTSCYPM